MKGFGDTYGDYCPVAQGAEVFATRWTPLVLRELLMGSTRFGELHRGLPRMSRSLLAQRLRELETAGLVVSAPATSGRGAEYRLTEAGQNLLPVVMALGAWARDWREAEIERVEPGTLMWDIRRRVDVAALPPQERTQIEFHLLGVPAKIRLWWLLVERGGVELCLKWPGFENDLSVRSHLGDLIDVWLGRLPLATALSCGSVELDGPRRQREAFRRWFQLSVLAPQRRAG